MYGYAKSKTLKSIKRVSKSVGIYGALSRVRYCFPDYQRELRSEKSLYAPFVNDGQLVFDVGANVGRKSQAFLELGARVVAFEPQPDCAEEIRLRCGSPKRLRVHTCAISKEERTAQLDIHDRSGLAHITSKDSAERTMEVEVYPLDKFVNEYGIPSFCKIDVEGFELEVLEGLSELPGALSFEYHATSLEEVERMLACLYRLREFGKRIEFNYTERTNHTVLLDSWMPVGDFASYIREDWEELPSFGDVFVRQK